MEEVSKHNSVQAPLEAAPGSAVSDIAHESSEDNASSTAINEHSANRSKRPRAGHRHTALVLFSLAAAAGIAAGAAVSRFSPMSAESFSASLCMSEQGGFSGILLRRMAQCCAFLLAEYIIGFFAAGGLLVWLAPFVCALGTGLSAAGAVSLGAEPLPIIFGFIYTAVIVFGAAASCEFSALLLRLVSGGRGSIVTDGSSAYHYTMRFILYLGIIFALAIIEAWARAAG